MRPLHTQKQPLQQRGRKLKAQTQKQGGLAWKLKEGLWPSFLKSEVRVSAKSEEAGGQRASGNWSRDAPKQKAHCRSMAGSYFPVGANGPLSHQRL